MSLLIHCLVPKEKLLAYCVCFFGSGLVSSPCFDSRGLKEPFLGLFSDPEKGTEMLCSLNLLADHELTGENAAVFAL